MPSLLDLEKNNPVKMLVLGDSGSGKTGALAALVKAGYNLHIANFDDGLSILPALLETDEEKLRVNYETFSDEFKFQGINPVPKKAKAWMDAGKWFDKTVPDLGDKDVLVIDSLTFMANAAFRHVLSLVGRLTGKPHQSDWGSAQTLIEGFLAYVNSSSVQCHVVINCHILRLTNDEGAVIKEFPMALGKALPPKVAAYFDHLLMVRSTGSGKARKREILTRGEGFVECKTSAFKSLPDKLPVDTGLATVFEAIKGN